MTALAYLVPIALALGFAALAGFLWALRSGQFEDLEGAGWRVLEDDQTLEHVQAKWIPVRRTNVLQTKNSERILDFTRPEPALELAKPIEPSRVR